MSSPILQYDLMMFSTIMRSEAAPVEKRYFVDKENKVRPMTVRPKHVLSKKQSQEKLHALFNSVMRSIPQHEATELKRHAVIFQSDKFAYQSWILSEVFKKYVPASVLKELVPSMFK